MTSQRCALGCLVLLGSAMLGLLLWTAISILHDLAAALQRSLDLLSGI
ncbi:hypothetical protein [Arthrobacter russicus]|uniref:Uncharacterized protein n=1 Tax=Arthrobacter russicus TaxID=172040 RepID=A0ABU1J9I8_9MICC|nr:hypothetical protein [Arthrobacter russicus]MBQ1444125.1 hypothetical protein [Renibacterium sp.]MDN5668256.1 hypothetical protein [Renibacterium salmoninarum]MDR6268546.1 hypothetical protein [Arthrobacter russicus]